MKLTYLMAVGLTTILLSGCASVMGRDQLSTEATGAVKTDESFRDHDRKSINEIMKDYPYPKTVCIDEFENDTPASAPGLKQGMIKILQDNGWTVTEKCNGKENANKNEYKTANATISVDVNQFGFNKLGYNSFVRSNFDDMTYNQVWGLSSSDYPDISNNHDERKGNNDAFTEEFNKLIGQQACYSLIITLDFELATKKKSNKTLLNSSPGIRVCRTNLSFQEAKPILIKKWLQLFELYMIKGIKKQWVNDAEYFVKPFDQVIKEAGID